MAKELARKGVDWAGRRLSRRGFVTMIGKIGLAVGAAAAGIGSLPERARAVIATPGDSDTGASSRARVRRRPYRAEEHGRVA